MLQNRFKKHFDSNEECMTAIKYENDIININNTNVNMTNKNNQFDTLLTKLVKDNHQSLTASLVLSTDEFEGDENANNIDNRFEDE